MRTYIAEWDSSSLVATACLKSGFSVGAGKRMLIAGSPSLGRIATAAEIRIRATQQVAEIRIDWVIGRRWDGGNTLASLTKFYCILLWRAGWSLPLSNRLLVGEFESGLGGAELARFESKPKP